VERYTGHFNRAASKIMTAAIHGRVSTEYQEKEGTSLQTRLEARAVVTARRRAVTWLTASVRLTPALA
jgi:adenylosuccinate synthase